METLKTDETIVDGRLLDVMVITECVKALHWEQMQTKYALVDVRVNSRLTGRDGPAVHLSKPGLQQIEPDANKWTWITLLSENGEPGRYPYQAELEKDGVVFFTLLTQAEKIMLLHEGEIVW